MLAAICHANSIFDDGHGSQKEGRRLCYGCAQRSLLEAAVFLNKDDKTKPGKQQVWLLDTKVVIRTGSLRHGGYKQPDGCQDNTCGLHRRWDFVQ